MMIHLKTQPHIQPQRFAILLSPTSWSLLSQPMTNDDQLFDAVRKHGSARIVVFEGLGTDLNEDSIEVPADRFCAEWQGD
jgi:hypothetical protein